MAVSALIASALVLCTVQGILGAEVCKNGLSCSSVCCVDKANGIERYYCCGSGSDTSERSSENIFKMNSKATIIAICAVLVIVPMVFILVGTLSYFYFPKMWSFVYRTTKKPRYDGSFFDENLPEKASYVQTVPHILPPPVTYSVPSFFEEIHDDCIPLHANSGSYRLEQDILQPSSIPKNHQHHNQV